MDDHTLEKLQFDRIRQALAAHCSTAPGRRLTETIKPSSDGHQVRKWLAQVEQLMAVVPEMGMPPMAGVRDIRAHLHASDTPAGLSGEALAEVAETLNATGPLAAWFARLPESAPLVHGLSERVGNFTTIARTIDDAVDPRGEVRDRASEKLAGIRASIDSARIQVRVVVDRLIRQSTIVKLLQYPNATVHEDRFVLPMKAEYRGRIPGIIHRSSDSGATLFVEPAEAVELNNVIIRLRYDEQKEVNRILSALSHVVHVNAAGIRRSLDAMAVLDLLAAKVRYAQKRQAIVPRVSDDRTLNLRQVRHPVLLDLFAASAAGIRTPHANGGRAPSSDQAADPSVRSAGDQVRTPHANGGRAADRGVAPVDVCTNDDIGTPEVPARQEGRDAHRKVVPIDIRLGDDFDLMVITGPNTGGKTAALKTAGLMAVMAQAGIPIPAAPGSCVPIYSNVFIDVGDEQSLEQSLSTFSSHLTNILTVLKKSRADSLVLIDELGAGTDPDEGAAIGRAVIDELLARHCSAMVTTHLSALKGVAYTNPRVDNAAVEFDVATLRPTYRLLLGEPGNSNAIVIAERLGMSPGLVAAAKSHLANAHRALHDAIAGTIESRRAAEHARRQADDARLESERSREAFEQEHRRLSETRAAHERWIVWVSDLAPGDAVFVKTFNRPGKVVRVQLHNQKAVVATGFVEVEVPFADLDLPRPAVEAK